MNTTPATATAIADKEPVKVAKPVAAAKPKSTPPAATTPKVVKAEGSKVTPVKKPAVTPKPSPAKDVKAKKPKLVRDSFTIPKDEYAVIDALKERAVRLSRPVKKSELLRAGLKLLAGLSDTALFTALESVPSIKTGRPTKEPEATEQVKPGKAAAKAKAPSKARSK